MNRDDIIESIVKEVKRVLAERGIPVAPASDGTKTVTDSAAGTRKVVLTDGASSIGTRDLTGKQIVTLKDLEAYSGSSIHVARKAIVTPLAVDYARSKGISIVRVEAKPQQESSSGAVVVAFAVAPDFKGDKSVVTAILTGKGFTIRDFSESGYEAAIKKVTASVAGGGAHFGVLVENSGMEGPIYGNRNTNIRAVHCRSTIDARAARVDYSANVVVIDLSSDPEAVISGFCGM